MKGCVESRTVWYGFDSKQDSPEVLTGPQSTCQFSASKKSWKLEKYQINFVSKKSHLNSNCNWKKERKKRKFKTNVHLHERRNFCSDFQHRHSNTRKMFTFADADNFVFDLRMSLENLRSTGQSRFPAKFLRNFRRRIFYPIFDVSTKKVSNPNVKPAPSKVLKIKKCYFDGFDRIINKSSKFDCLPAWKVKTFPWLSGNST